MANITISDFVQQKINNDNALLKEPLNQLKEIIDSLTENKKDDELLLDEKQLKNDQLVNTLSDLKEIEKQLKGNKAWAVLKTGAEFLVKPIQFLFKSKNSVRFWGVLLGAGAIGIGVCAIGGAAALATGFPFCLLAMGVGALGLAGWAIFSDKVGNFVKSCFSPEVVEGLKEIQNQISKETLPASSTAQPVGPISESLQQSPQEMANHNFSGNRLSLASDSDESESPTPTQASVSSFGHRS